MERPPRMIHVAAGLRQQHAQQLNLRVTAESSSATPSAASRSARSSACSSEPLRTEALGLRCPRHVECVPALMQGDQSGSARDHEQQRQLLDHSGPQGGGDRVTRRPRSPSGTRAPRLRPRARAGSATRARRQACTPIEIVTGAAVALPLARRVVEVRDAARRPSASSSSHARRRGHSRNSASCATSTVPSLMVSSRSSASRSRTGDSPRSTSRTACGDVRHPASRSTTSRSRIRRATSRSPGRAARRHPRPGARPRRALRRSAHTPRRSTAGRRDAARGRAGRSTGAEAHPARRPTSPA